MSFVSDHGLDRRGSVSAGLKDFSSSVFFQTGSGDLGFFPRAKEWQGLDADHSSNSNAEVKYEYEL